MAFNKSDKETFFCDLKYHGQFAYTHFFIIFPIIVFFMKDHLALPER